MHRLLAGALILALVSLTDASAQKKIRCRSRTRVRRRCRRQHRRRGDVAAAPRSRCVGSFLRAQSQFKRFPVFDFGVLDRVCGSRLHEDQRVADPDRRFRDRQSLSRHDPSQRRMLCPGSNAITDPVIVATNALQINSFLGTSRVIDVSDDGPKRRSI